jgi:hypothetical protein
VFPVSPFVWHGLVLGRFETCPYPAITWFGRTALACCQTIFALAKIQMNQIYSARGTGCCDCAMLSRSMTAKRGCGVMRICQGKGFMHDLLSLYT